MYIPKSLDLISEEDLWRWYCNIPLELSHPLFSPEEREYFTLYYQNAGLLIPNKYLFFRHHFSRTFAIAANFFYESTRNNSITTVLDLGCGFGTQAIFLALLGLRVIALDMDSVALNILEKRICFYEKLANRKLNIEIFNHDVFDFEYHQVAPIDGLYSLFAFNTMQPSENLLFNILPNMSRQARICIMDGNQLCWLAKLFKKRRRNALTPPMLEALLKRNGYDKVLQNSGIIFPPVCWNNTTFPLITQIDKWLGNHFQVFPISYQAMFLRAC